MLNLGFTTININMTGYKPFDYVAFCDKSNNIDYKKYFQLNDNHIILTRPENKVRDPVIYFDRTGYGFTHDYILMWLHEKHKNVKNVILIGAADFVGTKHYNSDENFIYCDRTKQNSINFIENTANKWFNLYKMNPNGVLNIPTIGEKDVSNFNR